MPRGGGAEHGIDALMDELGAIRFSANTMEHMDPLIHTMMEERASEGVVAGVILESLRPGYRTGSGRILAKAMVAVSGRR